MKNNTVEQRIMELEFYCLDLTLYLNTHPDDAKAKALLKEKSILLKQLKAE